MSSYSSTIPCRLPVGVVHFSSVSLYGISFPEIAGREEQNVGDLIDHRSTVLFYFHAAVIRATGLVSSSVTALAKHARIDYGSSENYVCWTTMTAIPLELSWASIIPQPRMVSSGRLIYRTGGI